MTDAREGSHLADRPHGNVASVSRRGARTLEATDLRGALADDVVAPTPREEPSLGELKARRRELHLCFRCTHHMVCGMAKALDTNLLVTIATCLAFEPDDSDGADGSADVRELLPPEPRART